VPTPLPAAPRPKAQALLFLLAAFLVGGGVGYAVGTMTPPQPVPPAAPSERGMREELARELGLSPAQRARFDWRRARSRELMRDVRPSLDAVRDSARVLLMASLDSTQQAALRRLIDRNQRAADSAARARGEPR
jgi:hypothetical protein